MKRLTLVPVLTLLAAACGGGEPPATDTGAPEPSIPETPAATAPAVPSGPLTVPAWMEVDTEAGTVHLTITAGESAANNYWNFNGAVRGETAITVPVGATVTIEFVNADPNMAHSLGVSPERANFAMPPAPEPVFLGAISQNPTSMMEATLQGEHETVQFVADKAGEYSLVCYIPGHSATGMWLYFNVSATGEAGIQTM